MDYLRTLKDVCLSLRLPYRYFVHWNISKAGILIYTWVLACILAFPWIIAIGYLAYQFSFFIDSQSLARFVQYGQIDITLARAITEHLSFFLFAVLLALVAAFFVVFALSYGYMLLGRVHMAYYRGTRLPFRSNDFFSFSLLVRSMGVLCSIGGVFFLLTIVYFALFIGGFLVLRSGAIGDADTLQITLGYLGSTLAVLFVLSCVYTMVRLGFAFLFLLLPQSEGGCTTVFSALRSSTELTR